MRVGDPGGWASETLGADVLRGLHRNFVRHADARTKIERFFSSAAAVAATMACLLLLSPPPPPPPPPPL